MGKSKPDSDISGVPKEIRDIILEDVRTSEKTSFLSGKNIGVSVSSNEELNSLGYSDIHLRDFTIEVIRHLLISGSKIIYGGDLRKEGFTEIISELAYQYRSTKEAKQKHFTNFFSFPIYLDIDKKHRLEFQKNRTEVVEVLPPQFLKTSVEHYKSLNGHEKKFVEVCSLSEMRKVMSENSHGRVFLGGRTRDYLGVMPGIIEEAQISLSLNTPTFLVGALGGASLEIIKGIKQQSFDFIKSDYHTSVDYLEFKEYYNSRRLDNSIDFQQTVSFLNDYGIERLSKNNGLTIAENERLFVTPHHTEIIYLIFKGLHALS